ncbi:unnamed protein product [Rhizoctonia solani]|uniref:CHAT domain-containing protein n=1 Tax=Rhizoctonia solani TaxID=456999 RepID=A0A8H3BNA5_9AGAM|nr:unnamed protein product [Rhizoctonia solani]
MTRDGHPDLPDRHASLGASYGNQYKRLGELADLKKVIECHTRALAITPESHPDMPRRHASLGVSYSDRYWRLGELADLEKAMECKTRALAITPNGHLDMARSHASLGACYVNRYQRLGELADLEKAIECKTRALAITPDGHPDLPDRHASLGVSYTDRYRRLGELADLEKAMECHTRALAITPDGHPNLPDRHACLGVSYTDRYKRLGELADLQKAMECDTRALAITPDGHPDLPDRHADLGLSYTDRYQRLGELADLEKAMGCHTRALALTPDGHPDMPDRHADLGWASNASRQYLLNPIEAYQTAIDLLPQFIWLGATTSQRYLDLSLTESLAVNACFAAIQSSNYPLALEWLEHARCVLHTYGFDTQSILPAAADLMTPELVGQQRRRLAIEYHDLLAQTHQLPGFESLLQPLKANRISAVRNGPVVVLNCHKDRCDALVITSGNDPVVHVPLPSFTEDKARCARSKLDISLGKKGQRQRGFKQLSEPSYEEGFETVLRTLWNDIVQPVLTHLGYLNDTSSENLPHITWCPTGPLTFLPLHAAGDYSQPHTRVFNYAISSYIPTLTALLASTPTQSTRESPLPGTTKELALVQAHTQDQAEYSQLIDCQATTAAVLDAMEQHNWVHLACHANQNVKDPIKSGFHLHDGTLDLSAISRRSFKNKGLAFLSACQTATGDENLPDEAIHLASGMLMAGYPSMIATMWSVNNDDAPFVADKVYWQLMKDGHLGNGEAGRALHHAVAGLREKVGEEKFGCWVPYIHIGS